MVSLDSYAVPNPAVVGRFVEGEAVLVLPQQGQVKVLNEVGARIWALADGARTLRQIAAALCDEYDVNQAQAEAQSGRDSVILTLEETWTELQDAIDKVQVQKKFLEASEERAKIAQAQYSSGLILFDNWIIIENDLVKTKKSFLDAQANALIAEANWIQAKGGTLDD